MPITLRWSSYRTGTAMTTAGLVERLRATASQVVGYEPFTELCCEAAAHIETCNQRILENEKRNEYDHHRLDAAQHIIAELVALIPLKDTLRASKDGKSLIGYFKILLSKSDARLEAEAECLRLREALEIAQTSIVKLYRGAVPHGNYDGGEFGNRFADKDEGTLAIRSALQQGER